MTGARPPDTGLTLVEMLIAMALVALIAMAGFSMLSNTVEVQSRTEARLQRLAEIQRAMHLLSTDLEQLIPGTLIHSGRSIQFLRSRPEAELSVRYALEERTLKRKLVVADGGEGTEQSLLGRLSELEWSFFVSQTGWEEAWVPDPDTPGAAPLAVRLSVTLVTGDGDPAGKLHKILLLPESGHAS